MQMLGPVLALLSAAASGFSVVLVGRHSTESNAFNMSLLISAVGIAILWPLAILLTDFSAVNWYGVTLFAVGGFLTPGLVRLFYYSGLKKLGTSINSSVFSIYPVYTAFLASIILSEILTPQNWIGLFSIALGVVFVELAFQGRSNGPRAMTKGLIFPIIGGITLGASSILRKAALEIFNAPIFGVAVAYTASFILYTTMLAGSKQTRQQLSPKRDLRLFWLAGIGQALSWILSFYALSLESVSVITPLLSVEPIFVVMLAYLYLRGKEPMSPKLIAGVILTVLGVILVTSSL